MVAAGESTGVAVSAVLVGTVGDASAYASRPSSRCKSTDVPIEVNRTGKKFFDLPSRGAAVSYGCTVAQRKVGNGSGRWAG